MKTFFIVGTAVGLLLFGGTAGAQVAMPQTSGVYLTADDYKNGRLSFEGDCWSKAHKLELHDVLHKSYIHVTHETEKRRFAKSDLFGFRACDGRDYRFASNLEHEILEARELYIYSRDVLVSHGRGRHTVRGYFFSARAEGPVLALTKENLKKTFPDNQKFHEALDAAFGPNAKLSEYDDTQKTFKVNELLIASRG